MKTQRNSGRWLIGTGLVALVITFVSIGTPAFASSSQITEDNVAARIAAANTTEDHQALAAYFRGRAEEAGQKVATHEKMLASYQKVSGKPYLQMKDHCGRLIESYRSAQKEFQALADEHAHLAQQ